MKHFLILMLTSVILTSCHENKFNLQYDNKNALYIDRESLNTMELQQDVYVAAYSDIYYESEEKKTYLTVILSLRNTSFSDTLFFDKIDYYSSRGELLKSYIDKVLVLRPMESMEYIVKASEKKGGAGANFVVSYHAKSTLKNPPFIESIMMGNLDGYRFAFTSNSVPINK
jgi:hypothetical protein